MNRPRHYRPELISRTRPIAAGALVLCVALGGMVGWGCSGGTRTPAAGSPAAEPASGSMLRGDRTKSAEQRTAKNRPHPWETGHSPHEADRLSVGAARHRLSERHRQHHEARADHMESFSHAACVGVGTGDRRACPFASRRWTVSRTLQRGIELGARGRFTGEVGRRLRRQILCHIAFGRGGGGEGSCPLHVDGVRAITRVEEGAFVLLLETGAPELVAELQQRARQLD